MRNSLKFLAKQTKLEFDVNCRYYNLLDVNPNATVQAIRSAYYRLAKKFHPDAFYVNRTVDADKKFAKITEAYEVLSDSTLRQDYDRFLSKTDKPKLTSEPEVTSKIAFLLSDDLLSEVSNIAKSMPKMGRATGAAVNPNLLGTVKLVPKVKPVKPSETGAATQSTVANNDYPTSKDIMALLFNIESKVSATENTLSNFIKQTSIDIGRIDRNIASQQKDIESNASEISSLREKKRRLVEQKWKELKEM